MARRFHDHEFAVRDFPVHILANRERSDHILTALQDERRYRDLRKISSVVGLESDARKLLSDIWVAPTEAVGQLCAELRPLWIAHNHRRHRGGPSHVIV